MALVLLNRFIDLCEAIEEGPGAADLSALDNAEFAGAGIPAPADYIAGAGGAGALPRACFVAERAREEAKDWVLATSMDRRIEQTLPRRPCLACGAQLFECAPSCGACKAAFPLCAITGFPVAAAQSVACESCGCKCSKPAYNALVAKTKACPMCGAAASTRL